MSHPAPDQRRCLNVWGWLLLGLLVCAGAAPFLCAGVYAGLGLMFDRAAAKLDQPPPPGAGLGGAGQGVANVIEWILTLGAGALIGGGLGALFGVLVLVWACRRWVAPGMRRTAAFSRPLPDH
jgi:hypothetical protein